MPRYRRGLPALLIGRRAAVVAGMLLAAWWIATSLYPGKHAGAPYALPPGPLAVAGGPSLVASRVDGILAAYGSPLQGHGQDIVSLSKLYRVDDAVALAFFVMESRAGTQGVAVGTHSFGNLRPMPNAPSRGGYRYYPSWIDGASEWFQLIRSLYLDQLKLRTVSDIVPVYAPSSDSNDPTTMIAGIEQLVSCWRGNSTACPGDPPGVRDLVAGN